MNYNSQVANQGLDGYMIDDNEKEAEMSLIKEIGNTIQEENIQTREPEMFDVDVDTKLDTTVEIEDDAPEPKDLEHQVLQSGDEILLTEDVRVVKPTEDDPSDILNHEKELEETANMDNRGGQKNKKLDFELAPYLIPFSLLH